MVDRTCPKCSKVSLHFKYNSLGAVISQTWWVGVLYCAEEECDFEDSMQIDSWIPKPDKKNSLKGERKKMRKCEVYKYDRGIQETKRISLGFGIWHRFGCNYEQFESGPGNYSTAIVEMGNGRVVEVDPNCIRFLEPLNNIA